MVPQKDNRVCVFGARLLLNYLKNLPLEIEGARKGEDIEHVHKMRVTTRRIRSTLPMFKNCVANNYYKNWLKEIKIITQSLGSVRDFDVKIDCITQIVHHTEYESRYKPGLNRLVLRLTQQRNKLQSKVHKTLNNFSDQEILEQMINYFELLVEKNGKDFTNTQTLYLLAYSNISKRLENLLSFEEKALDPQNVIELHKMRIAGKYFRYTLETFSSLYPSELSKTVQIARKLQEILGDIHDCDVWLNYLPEFSEKEKERTVIYYGHSRAFSRIKPGVDYLICNRQEERYRLFDLFHSNWIRWKEDHVWEDLQEQIYIPVKMTESIYPPAQIITLSATVYPIKPNNQPEETDLEQ